MPKSLWAGLRGQSGTRSCFYLSAMMAAVVVLFLCLSATAEEKRAPAKQTIDLPKPRYESSVSLEEVIYRRRSVRSYKDSPLVLDEVSQLLWAAGGQTIDGVTGPTRSYASAGGIYPLEIYLVAGNIKDFNPGVYRYLWEKHKLVLVKEGDVRKELTRAALGQGMILKAPASIVIAAEYPRATSRYGERGKVRYVPMDCGHAGQNIHLQAEALGLGTVVVGAFHDDSVKEALGIKEEPLYIMPVGRIR